MRVNIDNREILVLEGKTFVKCYKSEDIFENKGKKIEFEEDIDMEVAVFRIDGNLHCFSNICPHRHMADMHNGIISEGKISCPQHGWTYFIESGLNQNQRQGIKNLKKFLVFEQEGWVYVELPDLEIPKWREVPLSR
jgi:nitrite reductase/ring-hydroxylating ferredoxin subunit